VRRRFEPPAIFDGEGTPPAALKRLANYQFVLATWIQQPFLLGIGGLCSGLPEPVPDSLPGVQPLGAKGAAS